MGLWKYHPPEQTYENPWQDHQLQLGFDRVAVSSRYTISREGRNLSAYSLSFDKFSWLVDADSAGYRFPNSSFKIFDNAR